MNRFERDVIQTWKESLRRNTGRWKYALGKVFPDLGSGDHTLARNIAEARLLISLPMKPLELLVVNGASTRGTDFGIEFGKEAGKHWLYTWIKLQDFARIGFTWTGGALSQDKPLMAIRLAQDLENSLVYNPENQLVTLALPSGEPSTYPLASFEDITSDAFVKVNRAFPEEYRLRKLSTSGDLLSIVVEDRNQQVEFKVPTAINQLNLWAIPKHLQ